MQKITAISALIILIVGLLINQSSVSFEADPVSKRSDSSKQFEAWAIEHGKTYTEDESQYRYAIFSGTLYEILQHNQLYEEGQFSYFLGLNQFSDLTDQEFQDLHTSKILSQEQNGQKCLGAQAKSTTDTEFKWSQKFVTGVRDQGTCSAGGWAFAASASIEATKALQTGVLSSMSPQQLIDCSDDFGNKGCTSGTAENAFAYYIKVRGVVDEKNYPFNGKKGTCTYSSTTKIWEIIKCTSVTPNSENALRAAVKQNPVVSFIDASSKFKSYKGGIFQKSRTSTPCDSKNVNHGVLVVGFGTENKHDFWLLKNSYGTSWGDKGYMQLQRTKDDKTAGLCGIQLMPSFPIG